ncbi:MAG: NAD-dependent epimerase/dehydratase family protein [Candidatus Zixiibacteriota bacterium]|nr:MAG: NAD-dependent epimerase/dehydratase family protein [candidate division Zixibacteria bacterium]
MNILIAGGTGFVGSNLAGKLHENGHNITLLARPGSKPKIKNAENIPTVETDFSQTDISIPAKPDVLINCIGIIREFSSKGITFEKVHYETVRYLIELAKRNGIGRFLQVSALGVGPDGKTGYFQTKYKAEELLKNSDLNITIFRPSIIYGPRDEFINMIAGFVKKFSVMPVIGDGKYRLQPVRVDNLCQVIIKSLGDEFTSGKTFEIGGPEILTFNEIVDIVGNALGKKVIKLRQPIFIMKILAALFGRFSWFPVTRDQIIMLYDESYTDDIRLFDRYGITPRKLQDSLGDYL